MYNEVYITYFDLLGFKEFINNNSETYIDTRMEHIFRDIELSLTLENKKLSSVNPNNIIPDLIQAKLIVISKFPYSHWYFQFLFFSILDFLI